MHTFSFLVVPGCGCGCGSVVCGCGTFPHLFPTWNSPLGTNVLCLLFALAFSVVDAFLPGMTAKTEGVSVSIETTSGSSQSLAAALAVGGDWRAQINP